MLTGRCGCLQDRATFKGKEIVARQLTTQNLHLAEGRKVVVIGSAKTALDVAGAAAEVAETVTVLARKVGLDPCSKLSPCTCPGPHHSCPGPHCLLP